MGEIATSDWEVVLFFNPNSITAKKTLDYAKAEDLPIRDIDILKIPLTGTQLKELADRLDLEIEELVNKNHPSFYKHFGNPELFDEDWIKILKQNPEFLKGPIAIKGSKTVLVEKPSDIIKL